MEHNIHDTAIVDKDIVYGEGFTVRQFSSVVRGASFGVECSVGPYCSLDGCVFGDRVRIMHHVNMGPGFKIGNDVFIGPGVIFCNDNFPTTGKEGFDVDEFDGTKWAVIVGNNTSIGAGAIICPGVKIGRNCFIAAGEVIKNSLPDDTFVYTKKHHTGADVQIYAARSAYRINPPRMKFVSE